MASALATAVEQAALVDGDLLVASHAGYLSFLALEVLAALAPKPVDEAWLQAARHVVLHANVGEACAFELSPLGVQYLANPEATDFAAAKNNDAHVGSA